MDIYIYYSIILFSIFILMLYLYLLYEKIVTLYKRNRRKAHEKKLTNFIDELINNLENKSVNEAEITYIKKNIKSKIKRRILVERIIKFNEIYKGEIREEIIKLCEKSGLVDLEINNLKRKDVYKLALACKYLGELRSEKSIQPLLSKINIKSLDVRYHIFMALAKIGNLEGFISIFKDIKNLNKFSERSLVEIIDSFEGNKAKLYENMINHKDEFISRLFIKSEGNYMDINLNFYMDKYLESENKESVIAAIKTIGKGGDNRYIDKIINKLDARDWEIRAIASKSLGRFEDEKALEPLIKGLSDSQWWVRYNSANGILKIRNGINRLEEILLSKDEFAKDSIISAMEDSGVIQDIFLYEHLIDEDKKDVLNMLNDYIRKTKEKGEV